MATDPCDVGSVAIGGYYFKNLGRTPIHGRTGCGGGSRRMGGMVRADGGRAYTERVHGDHRGSLLSGRCPQNCGFEVKR